MFHIFSIFFLFSLNYGAWLQPINDVYLTGSLSISPSHQNIGDPATVILVLQNHTDDPLSILRIDILGEIFTSEYQLSLPTKIAPRSSMLIEFLVESQKRGVQELVVYAEYVVNPIMGNPVHRIDTFVKIVEIYDPLEFTWPEYLIPLILGFSIGQLTTSLNELRQRKKEEADRLTQATGTILALLQGARASIHLKEAISFGLWEDTVIKGNLLPSVQKLGRRIGKNDLSNHLSELAVQLVDYNDRHHQHQLNSELTENLASKITTLIRIFESYQSN